MKLSIFCCIVCKTFPIMMQNKKVSNTDLISSPQVWISNKSFAFSTVLKLKGVEFMLSFFWPTQNSAGQPSFSIIQFLSPKAAQIWLSWMNLCKYIGWFLPEKKTWLCWINIFTWTRLLPDWLEGTQLCQPSPPNIFFIYRGVKKGGRYDKI